VLVREMRPQTKHIRLFEPGMGPAAFSRYVFQPAFLARFMDIDIQGADISRAMVEYAAELMNELYQAQAGQNRIYVVLASGVNCIDIHEPYYQDITALRGDYDAVVSSQFEHYCPNHHDSELAGRLEDARIPYCTKSEFRHFCYDLLAEGGIYFTIDDRLGESPEEHQRICRAWDRHVVKQFTDEGVLAELDRLNTALARNLRISYDPQRETETLVHIAAKAREHRREICREEIEPLSKTRRDFAELFGPENVHCMAHPSTDSHPGFYLMWGIKKN